MSNLGKLHYKVFYDGYKQYEGQTVVWNKRELARLTKKTLRCERDKDKLSSQKVFWEGLKYE